MWELDHKEGWVLKYWCFWTVVLEKTLESPLESKEIKSVSLKGNQPWILFGRTDAEAEAPMLWTSDTKSQLIEKDPDAGKDWRQEKKGTTEDEMVERHHWFNGHKLGKTGGWWGTGKPGVLQSMGSRKSQTQVSNWATATTTLESKKRWPQVPSRSRI